MSLPWLRLDDDGNPHIEKVDPFEAAMPDQTPAPSTQPLVDIALEALASLLRRLDDSSDVDDLVGGWEQARTIADAAQTAAWHLAGRIGDTLGGRHDRRKATLRDGRSLEYGPGERRAWDRDRQAAALRALGDVALRVDRRVDAVTGEIESPVDVVLRVIDEAASIDWRARALTGYGLDPDRFSDLRAGRPSIRLIGERRSDPPAKGA